MKNTEIITTEELEQILLKNNGATFSHIVIFGDEHGSCTKDKKKVLQKLTFRNITIGAPYQGRIERRTGETFTPEEMKGKAFVEGSNCLAYAIKEPSKKYLVCDQELKTKVHTHYFHNGQPIAKTDAIAQGLFTDSYFAPKKTAGRGQVSEEKNFFRLTVGLQNVIAITYKGTKYRIAD